MHFLKKNEISSCRLRRRKASTSARLSENTLVVGEDARVGVADEALEWTKLPERVQVVDPEGKKIKPSPGKLFYVSLQSFNPYHILMEAAEDEVGW
jgi:hypothetical protein